MSADGAPSRISRTRLTTSLLRAWRTSVPSEEWRTLDEAELRRACAAQLEFGTRRRRHQTLLRVTAAPPGGDGSYSVIELIVEDMPFLVDSLSMSLSQLSLSPQVIVHPILRLRRDAAGHVRSLQPEIDVAPEESGGVRESWQYWRIDRISDEADCEHLRRRLLSTLLDVRHAFNDWMRMRNSVLKLCNDISRNPPPLFADVIAESRALLQYMENHHFTFLGYRESRIAPGSNGPVLAPVPHTALGLLRRRLPGARAPGAVTANIRRALRSRDLLIITKANHRSTVHRAGYLDYIGVKRFNAAGRVIGEARILGLWATSAYRADLRHVPWLRHKMKRVIERFRFAPNSHDAKRLVSILETLPRDELLQASVEDLIRCARAVLILQDRARVRLIMRRDEFRRFWSCLVYLPRERCDPAAQARIETILRSACHGSEIDAALSITDSPLAQLHVVVRVDALSNPRIDELKLEQAIAAALVSWRDRLRTALQARFGEAQAALLERRYATAFPDSYRQDVDAALAVEDITDLQGVDAAVEKMQLRLYRPPQQRQQRLHLRILRREEALSVSEVLPTFEHFGLRVIAERPYRLSWPDGSAAWVQDFELEHHELRRVEVASVAYELIAAFRAVRAGELDDDGFHRLLIGAALTVRQVTVLRACCRYLLQTGIPFSQSYMERVLGAHAATARDLCELFEQRLNPRQVRGSAARAGVLEQRIRRAIEAVVSPDEDRILRAFLAVILATLRTNYFRRDADGRPRAWLSMKFDPSKIPGLPVPRPAFEIFVHGPRVEGVHLRKGPIARGGIRWSERPEDFRTEVLGLMKAQHVKNTVIVPVGAKGGFVARRLPPRAAREQQQREVIECYRSFIRGLLDITDNIVSARVLAPPDVHRLDGDDPYLVVAADKGTATFSDIANAISADYGFWLGDAFASGGSSGYDHKKMGITARGAWECIKRHFRELNIDIQREAFTVAGIGDMSGDVFGNGMLLSRQLRLVAAFNHQHVFLDPNPDAARSYRERARLFKLPRSGWNDYNQRLLSRGGIIFERSVKSVTLSAQVRELLGLTQQRASPVEIIRAILCMRVDLIWNGGIGTYVKASDERNGEIGDRGNDAVRVDGRQVRARVIGEGGNLGLSQRGRIEYAAGGGKLNPDFIDNSAGVNTSDVEVNLKILLDAPGERALPRTVRDRLLSDATDEVAQLVLRNNYLQSEALSLMERGAAEHLNEHRQMLRWLERYGELDRAVEFLPTDEELEERRRQGRGLTRPELALLFAYGKIAMNRALTQTGSATDPYLARELERYFPQALRKRFADRIKRHRLRTQIIITTTTNSIINRVGPTLLMQSGQQSGADAAAVARAYTIARDSADLRTLWAQIEALDGRVKTDDQYDALLDTSRYLTHYTLWLLARRREYAEVGVSVTRLQPAIREFAHITPAALEGLDRERYLARSRRYIAQSLPTKLAENLAALEALRVAPDLVQLAARARAKARTVAGVHFGLSARLGLDWLHGAIEQLPASGDWQRAAQTRLQAAALAAHLKISAGVLPHAGRGQRARAPGADPALERWQQMLRDVRSLATPDFAALTVAVEALETLAGARHKTLVSLL
ncbi:MAG TPA: NAD-glutamate dehydrogenase [Steroidobacteraceae bacterium]|nr:NAD-glutamate dehydrogenase [Steroidobacteraceae bacterium]